MVAFIPGDYITLNELMAPWVSIYNRIPDGTAIEIGRLSVGELGMVITTSDMSQLAVYIVVGEKVGWVPTASVVKVEHEIQTR